MKVLVTGGSGFLGRHLVPRLRARGHEVLVPRSAELDLTDGDQTRSWLGTHSPQAIVHGAALYGGIAFTVREPATLLFRNSLMAIQLFEAAVASGVERVISIGSACAYPGATSGDMREEALWDGPLHPSVEAYGFSKRVQLVAQRACRDQFGLEGVHLAVTNLYGPHDAFDPDRSHVVGAMVRRFVQAVREEVRQVTCWGDGSPVREFLYVTDAADAIVAVLELDGLISPL
ncbi:MAG: NAD-dependent epimerase/dehydratase family protein, partial [Myxococcota bacterium]|nr:NAD-dependent epimerase/dehydratase family protein [Myxococcota bacterium]